MSRYQEYSDFVVLGAEFVVLLFLVFYTIEELVEIASLGKQYFMGFFNNTDYTLILLCLVISAHRAITYFIVEPSLKEVPMISDKFVDFTTIGFWSYFLDSLTGALAFLSWVRIFKYVSFNKVRKFTHKNAFALLHTILNVSNFSIPLCKLFLIFLQ